MPKKIRELIADLEKAGFVNRRTNGSHKTFVHPSGTQLTLSGNKGKDAKRYQEKDVKTKIKESE